MPTDCWKRTVGRLTARQIPILIGAIGAFALPVLTGLGARWSAQTEINHLRAVEKAMEMENGSYRAATSQLTSQIQSLESVINDLGARTALKPVKRNAVPKLPEVVESRASLSPDETFNALHGLLRGLENRLTSIRDTLAAATPSVWPTRGWLTSAFGTRNDPFTGQSRHHQGVDIATEKGQPVLATADGSVESAMYAGDYGNLVVVRHEFGLSTRYGHLSRFAVKAGQNVKRGDLIGYVGSTGRSTGPHLHYEILRNDRVIDPLQLLTRHADH